MKRNFQKIDDQEKPSSGANKLIFWKLQSPPGDAIMKSVLEYEDGQESGLEVKGLNS